MSGMFGDSRSALAHKSVEWYTPAFIFKEMGIEFDLDPASPHDAGTAVSAAAKLTVFDDGLSKEWHGRVWLNPPYGPDTGFWIRRFIDHGHGVALVFSRTDASWFQEAMNAVDAVLFMAGRIDFIPGKENRHKKGRSGAGTALFAMGVDCVTALHRLSHRGTMYLTPQRKHVAPAQ